MPQCKAFGCRNEQGKGNAKTKSFFKFPNPQTSARDRQLCEAWLANLKNDRLPTSVDDYEWKVSHRVCEDHFQPECFEGVYSSCVAASLNFRGKKLLKRGAVPTIDTRRSVDRRTGFPEKKTTRNRPTRRARQIRHAEQLKKPVAVSQHLVEGEPADDNPSPISCNGRPVERKPRNRPNRTDSKTGTSSAPATDSARTGVFQMHLKLKAPAASSTATASSTVSSGQPCRQAAHGSGPRFKPKGTQTEGPVVSGTILQTAVYLLQAIEELTDIQFEVRELPQKDLVLHLRRADLYGRLGWPSDPVTSTLTMDGLLTHRVLYLPPRQVPLRCEGVAFDVDKFITEMRWLVSLTNVCPGVSCHSVPTTLTPASVLSFSSPQPRTQASECPVVLDKPVNKCSACLRKESHIRRSEKTEKTGGPPSFSDENWPIYFEDESNPSSRKKLNLSFDLIKSETVTSTLRRMLPEQKVCGKNEDEKSCEQAENVTSMSTNTRSCSHHNLKTACLQKSGIRKPVKKTVGHAASALHVSHHTLVDDSRRSSDSVRDVSLTNPQNPNAGMPLCNPQNPNTDTDVPHSNPQNPNTEKLKSSAHKQSTVVVPPNVVSFPVSSGLGQQYYRVPAVYPGLPGVVLQPQASLATVPLAMPRSESQPESSQLVLSASPGLTVAQGLQLIQLQNISANIPMTVPQSFAGITCQGTAPAQTPISRCSAGEVVPPSAAHDSTVIKPKPPVSPSSTSDVPPAAAHDGTVVKRKPEDDRLGVVTDRVEEDVDDRSEGEHAEGEHAEPEPSRHDHQHISTGSPSLNHHCSTSASSFTDHNIKLEPLDDDQPQESSQAQSHAVSYGIGEPVQLLPVKSETEDSKSAGTMFTSASSETNQKGDQDTGLQQPADPGIPRTSADVLTVKLEQSS